MFDWLRNLFLPTEAQRAALEALERQAHSAKEQLNAALRLACISTSPASKVGYLASAKVHQAELKRIAVEHPRMRLTNEKEVDAAIKALEKDFVLAGYYAQAQAMRRQNASAHIQLSPQAQDLLK